MTLKIHHNGIRRSEGYTLLGNDEIDRLVAQKKLLEEAKRGKRVAKDALRGMGLSWWKRGHGIIVKAGEFHPAQRIAQEN